MYLSKISCNLSRKSDYRLVSDCYEMHRNVMSAFPDTEGNAREKYSVLYHLKVNDNQVVVLIQSSIEANWNNGFYGIDNQFIRIEKRTIPKSFYDFKQGQSFWFKLIANPSKKVSCEGKSISQRVFFCKDADQKDWLSRKSKQFGFDIIEDQIKIIKLNNAYGQNKRILFPRVEFEGLLCINNPELFLKAFHKGIGSEKAFGCGMLLLKRIAYAN